MLSVLLSALCPPVPLKSLIFWRYTNQIIIIIIINSRISGAQLQVVANDEQGMLERNYIVKCLAKVGIEASACIHKFTLCLSTSPHYNRFTALFPGALH